MPMEIVTKVEVQVFKTDHLDFVQENAQHQIANVLGKKEAGYVISFKVFIFLQYIIIFYLISL